jgi:hypothetical protein
MNAFSCRNIALFGGVILLGVMATGCGAPKAQAWNLSLVKSTPATIRVDLVGVSKLERPAWEGYDMDKYWRDGDPRRNQANKISLTPQINKPELIDQKNEVWQKWLSRGATELLIIADLPGKHNPGPSDPRRVFLPLTPGDWQAKKNTIEIEIQDTLIMPLTPMQPRK